MSVSAWTQIGAIGGGVGLLLVLVGSCRGINPDYDPPRAEAGSGVDTGTTTGGDGCGADEIDCDGDCVDPNWDPQHCGDCNRPCEGEDFCVGGACVASCPEPLKACEKRCVDEQSDSAHCGSCGMPCAVGEACTNGACGCRPHEAQCGDVCVNLQSSHAHCGMCGRECDAGYACAGGACKQNCNGKFTDCGDLCVNTDVDPDNCGDCDHVCGPQKSCLKGICE